MKTNKSGKLIVKIFMILLMVVVGLMILLPFWAIFIGTFQEGNMLVRYGLNLSIDLSAANFDNWIMLFTDSGDYFTWFFNSVFLTVLQVVGTLLISAFVAYGFAAYEFRFKNFFFVIVLLIMSVPFEMNISSYR